MYLEDDGHTCTSCTYLCTRFHPVKHSVANYVGMPTICRLWKELFPETSATYDASRWRDPTPDTEHLGLAPSVSERVCDQFWTAILAVVDDLANRVACVPDDEVVVGMVCRFLCTCTYVRYVRMAFSSLGFRYFLVAVSCTYS